MKDRTEEWIQMYSLVRSQRATTHTLQNVCEVNRERSRLAAASSVCNSTKHNGLVTPYIHPTYFFCKLFENVGNF